MTIDLLTASPVQLQNIRSALGIGDRNAANGFVGLNSNGDIVGTIQQRTGTFSAISSIVLKNGEIAYATDTKEIFIGDGTTAGGIFLLGRWNWYSEYFTGAVYSNQSFGVATVRAGGIYEWVLAAKRTIGSGGNVAINRSGVTAAQFIDSALFPGSGLGTAWFNILEQGVSAGSPTTVLGRVDARTQFDGIASAFGTVTVDATNTGGILRGMFKTSTTGTLTAVGNTATSGDGLTGLFGIRRVE